MKNLDEMIKLGLISIEDKAKLEDIKKYREKLNDKITSEHKEIKKITAKTTTKKIINYTNLFSGPKLEFV